MKDSNASIPTPKIVVTEGGIELRGFDEFAAWAMANDKLWHEIECRCRSFGLINRDIIFKLLLFNMVMSRRNLIEDFENYCKNQTEPAVFVVMAQPTKGPTHGES